jgi:hypothetical protein
MMAVTALVLCCIIIGCTALVAAWRGGDICDQAHGWLSIVLLIIAMIAAMVAGASFRA